MKIFIPALIVITGCAIEPKDGSGSKSSSQEETKKDDYSAKEKEGSHTSEGFKLFTGIAPSGKKIVDLKGMSSAFDLDLHQDSSCESNDGTTAQECLVYECLAASLSSACRAEYSGLSVACLEPGGAQGFHDLILNGCGSRRIPKKLTNQLEQASSAYQN